MAVVNDVCCKSHILFLRVLHLGTETFEWFSWIGPVRGRGLPQLLSGSLLSLKLGIARRIQKICSNWLDQVI